MSTPATQLPPFPQQLPTTQAGWQQLLNAYQLNLSNAQATNASVTVLNTQAGIGAILYPRTAAEIATAVPPTNYAYPPGNPWRYGADGLGGANDIAALATAKTISATTGVSGWQNGVPNEGYLRTAAEIQAGVIPTDFSRGIEPYDIRRYGAKLDGVTDDTAAWNTALLVASQAGTGALGVTAALGSAIFIPRGVTLVSSMILLPNRVRVLGVSKRGSWVRANPAGWSVGNGSAPWSAVTNYVAGNFVTISGNLYIATQASLNQTPPNATFWTPISAAMFYAQNGYAAGVGVSMFDSTLENLTVDANNVGGLGCVLSSAWQEDCGLRGVLLFQFSTYGVRFQDGFGGAALSKIVDTEIFSGTTANTTGIDLTSPIGSAAAFMLDISNTSITGGVLLTAGISAKGNSVCLRNVHFENCTSCVSLDGLGYISLDDLTGAGSLPAIGALVTTASTFTGTLVMKNCRRNGSFPFLIDNRVGGYGSVPNDNPLMIVNANDITSSAKGAAFASAWCSFNGFTTGTNPPSAGYNVSSVTRNSAGNYSISMLRPMLSAQAAAVASSNLTVSGAQTVALLSGPSSFAVIVSVSGVPTDSGEVKAIIFGG